MIVNREAMKLRQDRRYGRYKPRHHYGPFKPTRPSRARRRIVYVMQDKESGRIKMGQTRNLDQRLKTLRQCLPYLEVLDFHVEPRCRNHTELAERFMHHFLKPYLVHRREWYSPKAAPVALLLLSELRRLRPDQWGRAMLSEQLRTLEKIGEVSMDSPLQPELRRAE